MEQLKPTREKGRGEMCSYCNTEQYNLRRRNTLFYQESMEEKKIKKIYTFFRIK